MSVTRPSRAILWCAATVNIVLIANYLLWIYFPPNALLAVILTTLILLSLPITLFLVDRAQSIGSTSLVVIFIFFGLLITLYSGSPDWDTRSIWLLHAKQIYFDHDLYAPLDPYVSGPRDYPLMVPALMATLAKIVGFWNEAYPKSAVIFFYIAPLLLFAAIFRSFTYFGIFLIGLIHIGSVYLFNGYMDVVQALYLCAVIAWLNLISENSLHDANRIRAVNVIGLCLFVAIALQIKNEGIVGILCIGVGMLFSERLRRYQYLLAFTFALMFYVYYWKIPLALAHIVSDLFLPGGVARGLDRASSVQNWISLAKAFFRQSGFWLLCYGFCLYWDRARFFRNKLIFIFVILYTLALICVYLFTGAAFPWQLDVSIARTTIPINLCIFMYCLAFIQDYEGHLKHKFSEWFNQFSMRVRVFIVFLILSITPMYFWHHFLAPPFTNGQVIGFCQGCNGVQYLENVGTSNDVGWSHPESWGAWMLGRKAAIDLPMLRLQQSNKIIVRVQAFLPPGVKEQQFELAINGSRMGIYALASSMPTDIDIPFPSDLTLIERLTGKYLQIQFVAYSPLRPSHFGGADNRELSIGVISLTFQ